MTFFTNSSLNPWRWSLERVTLPWETGRPSIYRHVERNLQRNGVGLTEAGRTLPDDERVRAGAGFGWAPGALDGAFGHHGGGGSSEEIAAMVLGALRALTLKSTSRNAATLYSTLMEQSVLDYIDQLLTAIVNGEHEHPERLYEVARWLASEAPDREPVKVGIALLGLFRAEQDRELLLALGRHEEFTLYVVVALSNAEEQPDRTLWQLARHVTGWGRIHIVERLAETGDEEIKGWMLREGYSNDIMLEYTALICATTGDLLAALRLPEPDAPLLRGAGEILSALVTGQGGPAEGIDEYADGAEAAELYLEHLQNRDPTIEEFLVVSTIGRFLEELEEGTEPPRLEWSRRRGKLRVLADALLSRSDWPEKVWTGLDSNDPRMFAIAAECARALEIDVWNVYFERARRGEPHHWYYLMQTEDPDRIDRVVALAEEQLPLDRIAVGPADELGLGPQFVHHGALDFILQDLRRFPGKGWILVRTGLLSPVTRNRNMAVRALGAWERQQWPIEAESLLVTAFEREPNESARKLMRAVLDGESPEDQFV